MATQSVLLDTSMLIDYLRKGNKEKAIIYRMVDYFQFVISVITVFEVEIGLKSERQWEDYRNIRRSIQILPIDQVCIGHAINLQTYLKQKNKLIGLEDLLIASTALAHRLPVATLNAKHFVRIPYLQLADLAMYQS
jgi:tRNA(fMet)-specific endonuclease VapC